MKSLLWPPEKVLSGKMARASSGGSYFSGLSIFSKNSCSFQEAPPFAHIPLCCHFHAQRLQCLPPAWFSFDTVLLG